MKRFIVSIILLVCFSVVSVAYSKEIIPGEERVFGNRDVVFLVNFKGMDNKWCVVHIKCVENGEEIFSEDVKFYAYYGEYEMLLVGKELTLFHTEISGGSITALLDGKEI